MILPRDREAGRCCLHILPLACSGSLVSPWKELVHTSDALAFVSDALVFVAAVVLTPLLTTWLWCPI